VPTAPPPAAGGLDEKEQEFLQQLEADMMAKLMAAGADTKTLEETTGFEPKDIDELEKTFGNAGINPEDFFKELLAEAMQKPSSSKGKDASSSSTAAAADDSNATDEKGSFQDTIQKTLERMQESGDKATAATNEAGDGDLLEQLLKAMDGAGLGGAAGGENMDINQMFMGMMEQLSNKEMLYEPMKELHTKFGPWLQENRDKISADELERNETQARLVGEIVNKFDEPDFSDDKPECRSYIWERMQAVCPFFNYSASFSD
jgi:peroxin-19